MRWLFRPTTLVAISVLLAAVAAVLVFFAYSETGLTRAVPRPVPDGDAEIVFLNPATTPGWDRLVAAVRRLAAARSDLGLEVNDSDAFPTHTTAVPEVSLGVRGRGQRLWLRWYKLTGDLRAENWVQALGRRQPMPVAVIGGGSSDRARDLARALNDLKEAGAAAPPLLLLTTATADKVDNQKLMTFYPDRSFRFCFTNSQMAEAVTDFLGRQDDLRPDAAPVYLPFWEDDPYSEDLFERFKEVLLRVRTAREVAPLWAWSAGKSLVPGGAAGLELAGLWHFEDGPRSPFWSARIPFSVGAIDAPNPWEAGATDLLINELDAHPGQRRPLLILPAVWQPARRFLRGLMRLAPLEASRFVVATGDGIDFNTVYRDRELNWPIQDLPFALVFFSHRNPVDPGGFQADAGPSSDAAPEPDRPTSSSTADLLLYQDIVQTVVDAAYENGRPVQDAEALRQHLRRAQWENGRERFDELGNQLSGAGEYVVCLLPQRERERILPRATLQVWHRSASAEPGRRWELVRTLEVSYGQPFGGAAEGGP